MAKIMLVDDAAFMRMMLKNTLTQAGYTEVFEAEDGVKAVEIYAAEKEIKASDPGATIVMCSAMGQESMVMESIKSGAKDFIVKPFKPERILSTVKKILGE